MDWSNLFSVAGILLVGLTIYDFFMAFTCGLGGSGVCDGEVHVKNPSSGGEENDRSQLSS